MAEQVPDTLMPLEEKMNQANNMTSPSEQDVMTFLNSLRNLVRGLELSSEIEWFVLRQYAMKLYNLSIEWGRQVRSSHIAHLKNLSCRIYTQSVENCRDKMNSAEIVKNELAYGDLEPARQACDLAEGYIINACKLQPLLCKDDGVFMLKMDAMFRRCELSVALDNWKDGLSIMKQVKEHIADAGEEGKNLARKFGVLAVVPALFIIKLKAVLFNQYNFGIACISKEEDSISPEETEKALVWARQSADLFARSSPAEHARALALIANIQIATGTDFQDALENLVIAHEIAPNITFLSLQVMCLIEMKKIDCQGGVKTVLETEFSMRKYLDSKDTSQQCKDWLQIMSLLVRARASDMCNKGFEMLSAIYVNDQEKWEKVQTTWAAALASHIYDQNKLEETVDQLIGAHSKSSCSEITCRQDESGKYLKAIEWRKKAVKFANLTQKQDIKRQIVRIALRAGAIEVARAYIADIQSNMNTEEDDFQNQVLELQLEAKSGNVEKSYEMIQRISECNHDPNLSAEALNSACMEAMNNGSTAIVQKCLQIFVDNIVKGNPSQKISNIKVDKFWRSENVTTDNETLVNYLKIALDWIRNNSIQSFCSDYDKNGCTSIKTLSDCVWNLAVSNYQKIASCDNEDKPQSYDFTARMYTSAADLREIVSEGSLDQSDHDFIRLCRFLASAAWLLGFKQSNRDKTMESYLQHALDSLRYNRMNQRPEVLSTKHRPLLTKNHDDTNQNSLLAEMKLHFELLCYSRSQSHDCMTHLLQVSAICYNSQAQTEVSERYSSFFVGTRLKEWNVRVYSETIKAMKLNKEVDVSLLAQLLYLRINPSCEAWCQTNPQMDVFEDILDSCKRFENYPSKFVQISAVLACNAGIKHYFYGRTLQVDAMTRAEKWLAMAMQLSQACKDIAADVMNRIAEWIGSKARVKNRGRGQIEKVKQRWIESQERGQGRGRGRAGGRAKGRNKAVGRDRLRECARHRSLSLLAAKFLAASQLAFPWASRLDRLPSAALRRFVVTPCADVPCAVLLLLQAARGEGKPPNLHRNNSHSSWRRVIASRRLDFLRHLHLSTSSPPDADARRVLTCPVSISTMAGLAFDPLIHCPRVRSLSLHSQGDLVA
eukprot:758968-Hanusia_phi.AAC.7